MLKLTGITKIYDVADEKVAALNGVDIEFRKNEFVSILGPSGCGKTTLLNIIGGLDKYTSGRMEIDGVSTADYQDRDWDSYRNHSIGFVFQNYNLIPHLTVLDNVEIALTLVGEEKEARQRRALKALEEVGLRNKAYKKPNQLSGGQMQRVAIARALINNPDIILADEPTGALDSETSVQIMQLLKSIASTKLVIMVTHNGDLAREYSTRIVRLFDGKVVGDTNPYSLKEKPADAKAKADTPSDTPAHSTPAPAEAVRFYNGEVSSDLSPLSADEIASTQKAFVQTVGGRRFAVLATPKGKLVTALTPAVKKAAGGSLAEKKALSAPEIAAVERLFFPKNTPERAREQAREQKYVRKPAMKVLTAIKLSFNNLISKKFRTTLTALAGSIGILGIALVLGLYSGLNGFIYRQEVSLASYPITITRSTTNYESIVNTVVSSLDGLNGKYDKDKIYVYKLVQQLISNKTSVNEFDTELIEQIKAIDEDLYYDIYMNYNVGMNVVKRIRQGTSLLGTVTTTQNYYMTVDTSRFWTQLPAKELVLEQYEVIAGEYPKNANEVVLVLDGQNKISDISLFFNGLALDKVTLSGYKTEDGVTTNTEAENVELDVEAMLDEEFRIVKNDHYFHMVGSDYQPNRTASPYSSGVAGTAISKINEEIRNKIGGGYEFYIHRGETHDDNTSYDYSKIIQSETLKISAVVKLKDDVSIGILGTSTIGYTADLTQKVIDNAQPEKSAVTAYQLDKLADGMSDWDVTQNMRRFGYALLPTTINIYCKGYDAKVSVKTALDDISEARKAEGKSEIVCSDVMSIVLNIVQQFIDIITCALLALTAISLVVSALMIGIITYVSVLERTREIGVLRALGARKIDISTIFNAETVIIGFASGVLGVIITYLVSWPLGAFMENLTGIAGLVALPWYYALLLIAMSTLLTFIAGLIPATIAKRKDPVKALRAE